MKIFNWFRQKRVGINGSLISVFSTLLLSKIEALDAANIVDFRTVWLSLLRMKSLTEWLMWGALILLVAFNAIFEIARIHLSRVELSPSFYDVMKKYTADSIVDSLSDGIIAWGEGKTVCCSSAIIEGWRSEDVIVSTYDNAMYHFACKKENKKMYGKKSFYFLNKEYKKYVRSEEFQKIIHEGNNLTRVMLKDCCMNFDPKNRKLLLDLAKTEWSQTTYVWNKFGKKKGEELEPTSLMGEYSKGITSGTNSERYLPNSFCMHLIIETLDNKIIKSRISQNKKNDNAGTWAFSLGKQIAIEDFCDGKDLKDNFVKNWMKRAFQEEYRLSENDYMNIVEEKSLRILSVNFESDRYNFAMVCTVRLNYCYDTFYNQVAPLLSTEEAIELGFIELKEIPSILFSYLQKDQRALYHPSSYLRLLLFYMHRSGVARAERQIVKLDQKMMQCHTDELT